MNEVKNYNLNVKYWIELECQRKRNNTKWFNILAKKYGYENVK